MFTVPRNKDLKRLVRARIAETGENYTQALTRLLGQVGLEPLPAPWLITGSRAPDYEVGLLAGLWLRADGLSGPLVIDNMQDRPLRGTTDWRRASIVLDVPEQATTLHFGALLSGAGAIDLARPRFEEVGEAVPATVTVTTAPLSDEPQALDFGAEP